MHPRLLEAVRNNAAWCELVCAEHGLPGRYGERAWTNPRRTLQFYPDAISLTRDATADDVLDGIDAGPGASVKDSFASLDLPGFRVLFEATWIHSKPGTPGGDWKVDQRGDTVWHVHDSQGNEAMLNTSDAVLGVSNVLGDDPWPGIVATAARLHPGRDLVGYEDEAPEGFAAIGPLRIWLKD